MAGLCDRCQRPGRCCSGFMLNGTSKLFDDSLSAEEAKKKLALKIQPTVIPGIEASLPFEPMMLDPVHKEWRWWCTKWIKGRCSIYGMRPKLCDDYKPLMDGLCWHSDPTTRPVVEKTPAPDPKGLELNFDDPLYTPDYVSVLVLVYQGKLPPEALYHKDAAEGPNLKDGQGVDCDPQRQYGVVGSGDSGLPTSPASSDQ